MATPPRPEKWRRRDPSRPFLRLAKVTQKQGFYRRFDGSSTGGRPPGSGPVRLRGPALFRRITFVVGLGGEIPGGRIAPNLNGPGIVIIEAPMGESKTEAALCLADHWGEGTGLRGFYFALPTQATSNQMFGRVRDFLETSYRGRLRSPGELRYTMLRLVIVRIRYGLLLLQSIYSRRYYALRLS